MKVRGVPKMFDITTHIDAYTNIYVYISVNYEIVNVYVYVNS